MGCDTTLPRHPAARYGRWLPPFVQSRAMLSRSGCCHIQRPFAIRRSPPAIYLSKLTFSRAAMVEGTLGRRPRMPGVAGVLSRALLASSVNLHPFRDERAFEPHHSGPSTEKGRKDMPGM